MRVLERVTLLGLVPSIQMYSAKIGMTTSFHFRRLGLGKALHHERLVLEAVELRRQKPQTA